MSETQAALFCGLFFYFYYFFYFILLLFYYSLGFLYKYTQCFFFCYALLESVLTQWHERIEQRRERI